MASTIPSVWLPVGEPAAASGVRTAAPSGPRSDRLPGRAGTGSGGGTRGRGWPGGGGGRGWPGGGGGRAGQLHGRAGDRGGGLAAQQQAAGRAGQQDGHRDGEGGADGGDVAVGEDVADQLAELREQLGRDATRRARRGLASADLQPGSGRVREARDEA